MMTVAVTGGIGSGKSIVCRYFSSMGVPVYDSDSRTRALYDESANLLASLENQFGTSLKSEDGSLDRRKLASIVFSDRDALERLENIVHPQVLADFIEWRSKIPDSVPFVAIESAIILQKPIFSGVIDKVVYVCAPMDDRVRRAMERDGKTRNEIMSRVEMQGSSSEMADFIIENDSDIDSLIKKADCIFKSISGYAAEKNVSQDAAISY